jgi:hypothetical protein
MLRRLFGRAARGLPLARLPEQRWPRATPILSDRADSEEDHALRRYGSSGS